MTTPEQDWWKAHNSLRDNVVRIDKRVDLTANEVKHLTDNLDKHVGQTAEMFGRIEQQGINTHGAIDNLAIGQQEIEKTLIKNASVSTFMKEWIPWAIAVISAVAAFWQYAGR